MEVSVLIGEAPESPLVLLPSENTGKRRSSGNPEMLLRHRLCWQLDPGLPSWPNFVYKPPSP